jgi:hypothetical protein
MIIRFIFTTAPLFWIRRRVLSVLTPAVCVCLCVCVARYHLPRSPAASVTKAAKSTLEMGKEMVEKLAESAARATEEALERTTEKVRRKVSPSARRPDGDL